MSFFDGGPGAFPSLPGAEAPTPEDIALMQRVLSAAAQSPNLIPETFMSYVIDYVQVSRLTIPIGQINGFSQFAVQSKVSASGFGSITATGTGTDIPNGPFALDGLPNGRYVFIYGATVDINGPNAGGQIGIRLAANRDAPNSFVNANIIAQANPIYQRQWDGLNAVTGDLTQQMLGVLVVDMSNTSNVVYMEGWLNSGSPTNSIQRPFILGLRYANL